MKKIRFSLLHRSSKNRNYGPDKIGPVYVLVSKGRPYACIPTGVDIPGRNWNAEKDRVVGLPNAASLTRDVLNAYYEVIECYKELSQKETNITPQRLKEYFSSPIEISFSYFYEKEMELEAVGKAPRTAISYRQTFNVLREYQQEISFQEISDPSFILDFAHWLRVKKRHKTNNIHKHYKNLRKFINLAILRGYISIVDNPIPALKGKIKTEKVPIIYLSKNELVQMEELELTGKDKYMEKYRLLFLFTAYTGLRFSDATSLRESDFECTDGPEGIKMYLRAQKTDKTFFIPLRKLFRHPDGGPSKPERILQQILQVPRYRPGQRLFPFNNVQPYNRALKKMTAKLDVRPIIQEKIASHLGRKTCVNLLYGVSGDGKLVKAIVQHSQDRELMSYLDIDSHVISKRLDHLNW